MNDPDGTPWAGFQCARTAFCSGQRVGMVGHLAPAPSQLVRLPKGSACYRQRAFAIRLPRPPRDASIRAARVSVAGRPVRVSRKSGRWVADVVLHGRIRRTLHVLILETGSDGLRYEQTRTYHPCARRMPPSRRAPLTHS